MRQGKKLWLWKNGDHYYAFDNPFPCHPGGDPMTLGEPTTFAIFRTSVNGNPKPEKRRRMAALYPFGRPE
jgi:hypothetical protein